MAGQCKYEILESHLYTDQLEGLGNVERLDDALIGVMWALSYMPEDFPVVPGRTMMRMAKTEPILTRGKLARLRIWFTILNDHQVELLSIDAVRVG